jgi:DNA repair exonuclease SbcCD ATPase subunit
MLEFQKIRFKNFLSYGNQFTEVDFNAAPMTLISGKNGAGKSTIGEALTFALFGVPFRNINKPHLVNSINEKDCLVEIEFCTNKKQYLVRRGIKPTIFEIYCDGIMIDQDSRSKDYQRFLEQNILKLNYKSFTQLVFLGSSNFVPFMQLTAQDRREVIEELLDIRVFSRMTQVLKEWTSRNKEEIRELDRDIVLSKQKIDMQKGHIEKMQKKTNDTAHANAAEIAKTREVLDRLSANMDRIAGDIDQRLASIQDGTANQEKLKKHTDLYPKLQGQLGKLQKSSGFFESNDQCPTCSQQIDEDFKRKMIEEKKSKIAEIEAGIGILQGRIREAEERRDAVNSVLTQIQELRAQMGNEQSRVDALTMYSRKLEDANQALLLAEGGSEALAVERTALQQMEQTYYTVIENRERKIEERHSFEIAAEMLKDTGIKSKIVKLYLPMMNKLINKYLSSMDFFVNFNLDENFQEIIKSRYRDEFEYHSFSQGQKFRIDMALLLTWREISRKKNNTNTNILFLDEVFDSSLDANGTEDFMKLLRVLSKKTHIFVISHKPDVISDRFDRHLKIETRSNFSVMV